MFLLSRYSIATPIDGTNRVMLFSTRTGKLCSITETEYNKVLLGEIDTISENTIDILLDNELLVGNHENELATIIAENKSSQLDKTEFYQVIMPSAMCQLGCGYCGQNHTKDYISSNFSDKIIERFDEKLSVKEYKHMSIAWFGGEPLMGLPQIREMTKSLYALADKHNCTYSSKVVTNGLSLKLPIFLELVQKLGVKSIEVTLDGVAMYHDKRRHTKDGLSSFDIIFNNLLKIYNYPNFKELGCDLSIRCNVDSTNFDGVKPLIHLLAEHNLQDKIAYFYVAPIHSWGNEAHLVSLEKEKFGEMEMEWLIEQYKYGFRPNLLPQRSKSVCLSVSSDSEVFDAFGNVYDCTETPLVKTYKDTPYVLGNLKDGIENISEHRPLVNFYDEVSEGAYPCTTCPMLPSCGGGCPKSWREGTMACPSPKFNIKDRMLLYYFLRKHGVEALKENLQEQEAEAV